MTKQQLLKALEECREISEVYPPSCDEKTGHELADDLLLMYIVDPEISAAFKRILRWYTG